MTMIGLIAAMHQESAALLRYVKPWKRMLSGGLQGFTFTIADKSGVLITSGMGMRRAGEAARQLIDIHSPQLLISFGIAGAIGADLEIGDVVLPETAFRLSQGVLSEPLPLEPWPEAACEAATQALASRGRRLYKGVAITTGGSQMVESQLRELPHPVLEMETAGIAAVAAENGTTLFALRAISDGPRAPLPVDLSEVMDDDANLQAGRLLKAIVRNPRIILQSRQTIHHTNIAADRAALALVAALSQLAG